MNQSVVVCQVKSFVRLLSDVALSYAVFFLCRLIFFVVNHSYYEAGFGDDLANLVRGAMLFDTSAVAYVNVLFVVLTLFPLHLKEGSAAYGRLCKWLFVGLNTVAMVSNLCDVTYFKFSGQRTTAGVFAEFGNDGNLLGVIASEAVSSWYLVVLGAVLVYGLAGLYRSPLVGVVGRGKAVYYGMRVALLALSVMFCVFGMRGGMTRDTRPITVSNATQYVSTPVQAPLILNTPFCIIRTLSHKPYHDPNYFTDNDELERIYTPVFAVDTMRVGYGAGAGRNVIVLIMESFAKEYIGGYNKSLLGDGYAGYTPFMDSLLTVGMWSEQSYTNGRKSIDGMPSILASLPYFEEHFFLAPVSVNTPVNSLATELRKVGYHTSFFHGAPNGSMGFQSFAKAAGFEEYYGMDEYCDDEEFGGADDFDGNWAIWDEEFMQFYAKKLSTFRQPFLSSLFTASNHHPFNIPERYRDVFVEEEDVINKCTRYSDYAMRRFFEVASKQEWFKNSVFVICSDHTNRTLHPEYRTTLGLYTGPVLFYSPGDTLLTGKREGVFQQLDVMPTLLNYLGHREPFVAFGHDLLNTAAGETSAVSYGNGIYQIVKGGYFLQYDGVKTTAVYSVEDKLQEENLVGRLAEQDELELELKAVIQQFMRRMVEKRLVVE